MAIVLSPSSAPRWPITVVLFDVDGVLWDTRLSYDVAILKTIDYMVALAGRNDLTERVGEADLRLMRRAGRLNSDWALTYVLFAALLHGYQDLGQAAQDTAGQGVHWAYGLRGDVSRLEFDIIQKSFDLVYWGHEAYARVWGTEPPLLPVQNGTWHQEVPLIADGVFAALRAAGIADMGIATGRSAVELQTVLQNSDLTDHIPVSAMCTADILTKPDPAVVRWCLERLGYAEAEPRLSQVGALFCGDTRDDLQLALNYAHWDSRPPVPRVWLGGVAVVPESEFAFFLQEGAVACIDHVQHLPELIRLLNERTVQQP